MSILLIEDNKDVARIVTTVINGRWNIAYRSAAREGVRYAQSGPSTLDLVICDLNFPDYPGLKAIREIREVCPHTPIIAYTGDHTAHTASQAHEAGANEVIVKDSDYAVLLRAVDRWIGKAA